MGWGRRERDLMFNVQSCVSFYCLVIKAKIFYWSSGQSYTYTDTYIHTHLHIHPYIHPLIHTNIQGKLKKVNSEILHIIKHFGNVVFNKYV